MILHPVGCACCGGDPFATRFTALAFEAEVVDHVLRSMEEDGGPAEPGTHAFAKEESAVTAVLSSAVHDAGMAERWRLEQVLKQQGDNLHGILHALEDMDVAMSAVFDETVEDRVSGALADAIVKGAKGVTRKADDLGPLASDHQSLTLHEGIVRAARYSTNKFFNSIVIPAVTAEAERLIQGVDATDTPDLTPILGVLDQRLRSVPYWNVVANAAASRGFHYGLARVAEVSGFTTYTLVAVVDAKTSKVCVELNGRRFRIADAVSIMDQVARAETVEEVKLITPWVKPEDVRNRTDDELVSLGVLCPPFHGRCRTTMVIDKN